ncbi:hypothetical protein [Paenibacillus sp. DMB5]|uniref:hypothetical protein n=1 Tax=Paenibacillus sp. DMB5 TaxID=1780103 RepID=UPI00076D8195|nr:hypothetical protein [Paenibacillus sp. DMB5]KUP22084.1 hypothetical protein AWJ19_21485 [Paenibacillus sp. DMB5]
MSIHIRELLPKGVNLTEFKTGSELLLACELGKYTKLLLQEDLSVAGVNVADEFKKTSHFSFVVKSKFVNDLPYGDIKLAKFNHGDFLLKTQSVARADIKFKDRNVYFNYNSDVKANREFRGKTRSAAYVSLMAFVLVKNFIDQEPNRKLIIDHEEYEQKDGEYTDLIELQKGGILPETILKIKYKTQGVVQLPWETIVKDYRSKGLMNREYSPKEKNNYLLTNGLEVGDVVLLYSRNINPYKGDTIGSLDSCYPAVIKSFNENTLFLRYYCNVETKLTQRTRIDRLVDKIEGLEEWLTPDDYDRTVTNERRLSLTDIGVGTCTYLEDTFIFKPPMEADITVQWFKDKDNQLVEEKLDTPDTIFAVFEDRGVKYNRDKFLKEYFTSLGKIPIYYKYFKRAE